MHEVTPQTLQSKKQTFQQLEKKKSFVREYWYVFLAAVVFFILAISYLLRILTPPTPPPNNNYTWNGVTAGYSSLKDVEKNFGPPINTVRLEDGARLEYKSSYFGIPNEVVVDSKNTVQFLKENIGTQSDDVIQNYTNKFGQPDLIMFNESVSDTDKAHIFLKEGLVVVAQGNYVTQKWYFKPTTKEVFLATWGKKLKADHEPEQFKGDLDGTDQ